MYLKRLGDLRTDSDKTQKEISEILICNTEVYARYERGYNEIPLSMLIQLAKFYNVSTDYILELTDDPHPYKRK